MAAGIALLAPSAAAFAQNAQATPTTLESFSDHADAPGMEFLVNGGSQTQGPQAGTVPEATSDLSAGIGHGLGSLAWPGSTAGNIGGVIAILGAVPQPVQAAGSQAKDPARAETFAPGGPADATYPTGADPSTAMMRSHADLSRVEAWGNTNGTNFGAGSTGPIKSHSNDALNSAGTAITAQSNVSVSRILLGPGVVPLVSIDSVLSTATTTSDGRKATAGGSTTVSGLKVAGVPATVDQSGFHLASTSAPLGQPASAAANQAVARSGLEIFLASPTTQVHGAHGYEAAGGLVVQFTQNGYIFTITFGGASAESLASPGIPTALPAANVVPPIAAAAPVLTAPQPSNPVSLGEPVVQSPAPGGTGTNPEATGGIVGLASSKRPPFKHVPLALILLGIAGALLCAFGLKRMPTNVLGQRASATTTCPLERSS
jgi:hypothetical protein